jgi:hypothetical protein
MLPRQPKPCISCGAPCPPGSTACVRCIVPALPVNEPKPLVEPEPFDERTSPPLFELVVRRSPRLNAILRHEASLPAVTSRLLWLSLLGLAVHGLVVGATAAFAPHAQVSAFFTQGHPPVWMPLASMLAFVGSLCLCLPSFYFYTQLAGLDASFRLVTAQALRGQATTSVLLLGVLPFYAAWALACVLGFYDDVETVLTVGMALPFGVGLFGVAAIHQAFVDLSRYLPITHRRRGNFLRRMVLAWGAVYTVVAPVALVRLSQLLGERL